METFLSKNCILRTLWGWTILDKLAIIPKLFLDSTIWKIREIKCRWASIILACRALREKECAFEGGELCSSYTCGKQNGDRWNLFKLTLSKWLGYRQLGGVINRKKLLSAISHGNTVYLAGNKSDSRFQTPAINTCAQLLTTLCDDRYLLRSPCSMILLNVMRTAVRGRHLKLETLPAV